jgi:hypothetical protein
MFIPIINVRTGDITFGKKHQPIEIHAPQKKVVLRETQTQTDEADDEVGQSRKGDGQISTLTTVVLTTGTIGALGWAAYKYNKKPVRGDGTEDY